MFLSFITFRSAKGSYVLMDASQYTQYNMTAGASLPKNPQSDCPCAINNYTCIPNCCCAPKCRTFYKPDDERCIPVPSLDLVTMCSSMSKDTVGSVSNWLMRTILCVYRENNPLTKRGETFEPPSNNYEATSEQLKDTIMSHISAPASSNGLENYVFDPTTATREGSPAPKENRGYQYGKPLVDSLGTNVVLTVGTHNYPLLFGINNEFQITEYDLTNLSIKLNTADIRGGPNNKNYLILPNVDSYKPNHKFVSLSCSVLYRSFGYKQGPQNVIDSVTVKYEYSDYPEENHQGFLVKANGSYIVGKVSYYELPNDQNLFKTTSSADESSWLPFYWKGVNY